MTPMISIIIPVYNNAPTLAELAERIVTTLAGEDWEIVFVNDGSRDDSLAVLRELAAAAPRIKVVALSRNFGQHPATNAGMVLARGREIVFMDADLQDRPEDIPLLLARLRDRARPVDIVYTVKSERYDAALTRLTSMIFHHVHSRLTGLQAPPGIGTFRAFTRRVMVEMLRYGERNILYGPLMLSMGYAHDFIHVPHMERGAGKSSYSFGKRLGLAVSALVRHTDIPYRIFLFLGGGIIVFSFLYAVFNILQYLFWGRILMGGLEVIILLMLFFMGTSCIAMGLIGLYIFQIFQEALRRPRHHIAETINLAPRDGPPFEGP
ncbi:glycosyltransferase family 2 protein [Desulfolutivibrio sulfoxidireducens]|uniref:glycosyltransferase family 2 protein n=1 Tax=Desulfolutivibrio sulfoxidireducens TaxID=2773299 RepID=UPI00159D94D7|nr:glycosyltransferase family 2 protein [Desulfolutivibrio sulfoxidireducens]QLA15809.1 glycosyltransferase [Desulfolutivibrio sulfoxidireducens]